MEIKSEIGYDIDFVPNKTKGKKQIKQKKNVDLIEVNDISNVEDISNIENELSFSEKEKNNYIRQKDKCIFKNPKDEYNYAITQKKICQKCLTEKNLSEFSGNTSGTDAFDKDGYRLRRPECKECKKNIDKGKNEAKKKAKKLNIPYVAPEGTLCGICKKPSSRGNNMVFDHCHLNNIFRGYCCNSCNRSIGVLGDNIDGLLKAINYLLKTEKCTIIQTETGELIKK